ncbi:DUF1028 domain-containing protein [Caulobacter segnis]|uniref:DUF1028 domain-containing protein n=1 Tax=Caulobacter segnis TaxID=88688 RepID=UPI00240F0D97|nr:DUF1028 domain-containing protein [Caulobacter segnis]MDG2522174.1 DUF1028 domain-containing protein [Caulobacter segnis]
MTHRILAGLAAGALALVASPAWATFSIIACDKDQSCGVAVATNNLAVGASVPYARAGVGALVTQFETNPDYGPKGLRLLSEGRTPDDVRATLLAEDGGFEGQDQTWRQIAVISADGQASAYTGDKAAASPWAGHKVLEGLSVQGNGLAGPQVLDAMTAAFRATRGSLAERLLASLEAGEAAGGQTTGRMSAALLVRDSEGGWRDVDLRVDASGAPVPELRRLFSLRRANEVLARAERAARQGRPDLARGELAAAIALSGDWDRVRRRAARLQMTMGDHAAAIQSLQAMYRLNPRWAISERETPLFEPVRAAIRFED